MWRKSHPTSSRSFRSPLLVARSRRPAPFLRQTSRPGISRLRGSKSRGATVRRRSRWGPESSSAGGRQSRVARTPRVERQRDRPFRPVLPRPPSLLLRRRLSHHVHVQPVRPAADLAVDGGRSGRRGRLVGDHRPVAAAEGQAQVIHHRRRRHRGMLQACTEGVSRHFSDSSPRFFPLKRHQTINRREKLQGPRN